MSLPIYQEKERNGRRIISRSQKEVGKWLNIELFASFFGDVRREVEHVPLLNAGSNEVGEMLALEVITRCCFSLLMESQRSSHIEQVLSCYYNCKS